MNNLSVIFSFWIFVWYLLYICNLTNYNPKFAIIVAIISNILVILMMIYYKTKLKLMVLFIIIMCLIKLIPIYTIRNTKITKKDIIATFILLILYLIYLKLNNKSMLLEMDIVKKVVIDNKNVLPGMDTLENTGMFKFLDKK
jgi:hypothetical protein